MYSTNNSVINKKYVLFIYPIPTNLTWQTVKDHVRAIASTVTRVEVPRDSASLNEHGIGWVAVKGPLDATNLFRILTQSGFLGRQTVVHMFETTQCPPCLLASNCQPGVCSRCFELPITQSTADFIPTNDHQGINALTSFQFHHPTPPIAGSTRSPYPAVNASRGARMTELRAIFITNLNYKVTVDELREIMRRVGDPLSIRQGSSGKKTYATIEFASPQEAQRAIDTFDGKVLKEWTLRVRHDRNYDSTNRSAPPTSQSGTGAYPAIVDGSNWSGRQIQHRKHG